VTNIVLSVYLLTLISPSIRHEMDHTQVNLIQLKTFELELDFAEYIQYTDVRIADLCWAPIYHLTGDVIFATATVGFVLTWSPSMSFLARLVSDNSRSLKKI